MSSYTALLLLGVTHFKRLFIYLPPPPPPPRPLALAAEGFKKRIEYLKKEGNQAHRAKDSRRSLWLYERALAAIEKSAYAMPRDLAILHNNMAAVHVSVEDYGAAIERATKSVTSDPSYHKVKAVTQPTTR